MRRAFCVSRSCSRYSLSLMRPRPCSPGGEGRFSTGHLGLSHLEPFRKSLVFSRRQSLQSGPVYLANVRSVSSDAAPLRWAAAVVRDRGDVLDALDLQASGLQGADGRLPARAGALDEHVDLADAVLLGPAGGLLGGELRRERGRLAGPLEADVARRRPRDRVALWVGDGHDRVVEARLDVGVGVGDVLLLPPPWLLRSALLRWQSGLLTSSWPSSCRPPSSSGPCGCARWCACAGRGRAGPGGAGCPGSSRSRSCA